MEATPPIEARSRSQSSTPPPSSSSAARLWRPAAQRNLRNQWSKLNSLRQDWRSAASSARSHATAIVNSYLSQKYMDQMDFGVLSDMPNIRKKACSKLLKQQVALKGVIRLAAFNGPASHRGTSNSPLAQFSFSLEDDSDSGDCGGIPVFTFCSIDSFEELAWEIVRMFISELNLKVNSNLVGHFVGFVLLICLISHISHLVTSNPLPQRLLVVELLSIYDEKVTEITGLHWSDELYDGEFNDLTILNLCSKETREPILPCLGDCKSSTSTMQSKRQQDSNVLQVYLTTWLVEVNIDRCRMDEIFASVGGEMHIDFLETFG
ncbi:hypothetical protein DH2020_019503 [Rehmannia glutinosa]|uniref:Uncharacterized protein n=1 Tax=Rehmannia glutinosa TaxID=99300 RepID=A0ABR0WPP3_REHGL